MPRSCDHEGLLRNETFIRRAAVPYPPPTGNVQIALNDIKSLAVRHTVDLISFEDRKNPNGLGDLPRWCNGIKSIDRPPRRRVLVNMMSGIARDPHLEIRVLGHSR